MQTVRSRSGVPLFADFTSPDGTPIVIDQDTGRAYIYVNSNVAPLGMGTMTVMAKGAKGDGLTDDAPVIQAAANALPNGGRLHFPRTTPRYLMNSPVQLNSGTWISGDGMFESNIRYTGNGDAFTAAGTGMAQIKVSDLTVQLSGNNATAFACERFMRSRFDGVRVENVGGIAQKGFRANITDPTWTSFRNLLTGVLFDGVDTGVYLDSSVAEQANRWKVVAPAFENCGDCFNLQSVQGIQVLGAEFDEQTRAGIRLGPGAARCLFTNIEQETSSGGSLLAIDPACNRLQIFGWELFAGNVYEGGVAQIGTRALILNWDQILTSDGAGAITVGAWP